MSAMGSMTSRLHARKTRARATSDLLAQQAAGKSIGRLPELNSRTGKSGE
jgi:hypothetical protein